MEDANADAGGYPLVSVIVPAFNRAGLIGETLDSVRAQDWRPLEVVIVDDGSADGTADAARAWAACNAAEGDLQVIVADQANRGVSSARNHGMRLAGGQLICFVDSDDLLAAGSVSARARALMADPSLDFAYQRVEIVGPAGEQRGGIGGPFGPDAPLAFEWHTMGPLYRRKVFEGAGGWNENLRNSEDLELHGRIKLHGFRGQMIDGVAGYYRQHVGPRLISHQFSARYVDAAAGACLSLAEVARSMGKLDPRMGRLLARRLLLHALEFGEQGMLTERDRLLSAASALPCDSPALRLTLRALRLWHLRALHGTAYRAIRRING